MMFLPITGPLRGSNNWPWMGSQVDAAAESIVLTILLRVLRWPYFSCAQSMEQVTLHLRWEQARDLAMFQLIIGQRPGSSNWQWRASRVVVERASTVRKARS